MVPSTLHRLEIDRHRILCLDEGIGPPVLLLHGNPDSHQLWSGVIERLAPRFRCLAPDLPGFGQSIAAPDIDDSLPAMARFIDQLVTALGVEEPLCLAVHDFGGPYGLSWAVEHPEKVRRIAVTNTLYFASYRWHFWARVWRTPWLGELSMKLMGRTLFHFEVQRGSRKLSKEYIEDLWQRVDAGKKRRVLALYRATDPTSFRGWEERLQALATRVPLRVLWGEHDPYIPPRWAEAFGTQDIHLFQRSGHWLPAEEPAAVADHLAEFFV